MENIYIEFYSIQSAVKIRVSLVTMRKFEGQSNCTHDCGQLVVRPVKEVSSGGYQWKCLSHH